MSGERADEKVFCPVCSVRFLPPDGAAKEGDELTCPVCGQRLIVRLTEDGPKGERADMLSDAEIRTRIDEFARIRGYSFNEMKEEIVGGLLAKRDRFGDFYCPCRLEHTEDYQCPCRPTRGGDVERRGRCHCGLFWKD
jgi:ferredoxin-thioredoxin reductase catalytic subunit/DNA-directed RNA polymerase subunit RPC12/RpoP